MELIYTKNNTTIIDSYKYNPYQVAKKLMKDRRDMGLPITRTYTSYLKEIKAHNRLYKLGIARTHTKDCDCNEDLKKITDIIFRIIGC